MSNTKNNTPDLLPVSTVKGLHAIVEHAGAISHFDCAELEALLTKAARAAGATILGANFHDFGDGMGNTGVLILAESHMSVHTWPENNYAAIDIFVCSDGVYNERDCDNAIHAEQECNGLEPIEAAINILRSVDKHGCFHTQIINRSVPASPLKLIDHAADRQEDDGSLRLTKTINSELNQESK